MPRMPPFVLATVFASCGDCITLSGVVQPTGGARIAVAIDPPAPFKLR